MHARTRLRLEEAGLAKELDATPGLGLCGPLGYLDFLALESAARLVLTDSGGVQEETTVFGVPCLTMRTTTERPVTITEGSNRLVDPGDTGAVLAAVDAVLAQAMPGRGTRPELWDGHAADRIVAAVAAWALSRSRSVGPVLATPASPAVCLVIIGRLHTAAKASRWGHVCLSHSTYRGTAEAGGVFVSWAPFSRRTQTLSRRLGLEAVQVQAPWFKRPVYAPLKYPIQLLRTAVFLARRRPRQVWVMDPPAPAVMLAWLTLPAARHASGGRHAHGRLLRPQVASDATT